MWLIFMMGINLENLRGSQ